MLRVITLVATIAAAGTLAGTASAHPPDLYDRSYGAPTYTQPTYVQPTYTRPTYRQPAYTQPAYNAPVYNAPAYSGGYANTTYNATPLYSKTYRTPSYPAPAQTYSGYASPSYGYRHNRRGNYSTHYAVPYGGYQQYGSYSHLPSSEGLNYGYAGGPTYGSSGTEVINGVEINRSSRSD